jgi:hypothetical protein
MKISSKYINAIEVLVMENEHLKCELVPALGGKFISVFNKQLQKEFLWTNQHLSLAINEPGTEYDPNFFGGIDELIPNDVPENIDGIDYPDHGELWTTELNYSIDSNKITLSGILKQSELFYCKVVSLDDDTPAANVEYTISNESDAVKNFLWKMHAALQITENDVLTTSAAKATIVDPAYSRFSDENIFAWPVIEGTDASIVPAKNNTMDFFFLYDTPVAEMKMLSNDKKHEFSYTYDKNIFPYQWYFASYGGFLDHYTAILEPCTAMPLSVNEAKSAGQCTVLQPGEILTTTVSIFAGLTQMHTKL